MQPLLDNLRSGRQVIAAELARRARSSKPRRAWTPGSNTYHAVRSLTRAGTFVFLTDSAVGSKEEDNLRHLVINLGSNVPRSGVVPFLTCKHPLDYCLAYADRAHHHGFEALVVLGGDKSVGDRTMRRARMAAARRAPAARAGPGARRLGEPASNRRDPGRAPPRRTRQRRVLPDADCVASQPAAGRGLSRRGAPAGADHPRDVRGVLLPFRERPDARGTEWISARSGRAADRGIRRGGDARGDLRALHPRF